jgi:hypothetical protein
LVVSRPVIRAVPDGGGLNQSTGGNIMERQDEKLILLTLIDHKKTFLQVVRILACNDEWSDYLRHRINKLHQNMAQ